MLASQKNNLYTVIDSQLGILVHRVPRQSALVAIYSAVEDEPPIEQVNALLDATPLPSEWRTEWAAATAIELEILDDRLDDTPTTEQLTEIKSEVKTLTAEQQTLMEELRIGAQQLELQEINAKLKEEHERLLGVLADEFGIDFEDAKNQFAVVVWDHLSTTARFKESMKLYNALAREGLV